MVSSFAIGLVLRDSPVSRFSAKVSRILGRAVLALTLVAVAGVAVQNFAMDASAQSAVTGAISGVVTDSAGAVVAGAQVIVTDTGTDAKQTVVTNAEGRYTVGLLKPSVYKITSSSAGLKSDSLQVTVIIGTTIPGDIKVTPTGDSQVVDVNATTLPLLDTQNVALATTFNEQQLQELPTPGGDVTTVAFTLPGVVVNAGGSYGNFSSDGLPGISNLFVLNGFDNQDPFLNLNNSGSSNLTLGQGELAEATVVQNGYNSQYGRAAGAVINYTTKSGTNKFHGMADYDYNGTVLNANGWINQLNGGARPHAVANQWAVNAGGPIIRDKVFFFADYEGLRYVLPATGLTTFPTAAFQTYALATADPAALPVLNDAFTAYQGAPSYGTATPVTNGSAPNQDANGLLGCGDLAGTAAPGGGYFGAYPTGVTSGALVPCMTVANSAANNINKEWLFTGRADWNISDKHKIYGRYKMDRGSQPTSTSFVNPLFSALSIQPEYEGQFNDSYVLSPTKTNVIIAAANWYTAYFGPVNLAASQAAMPFSFLEGLESGFDGSGVTGAAGLTAVGVPFYLTQGRNVTQYQLEDDFNWIHGKHTIKVGANFRRDLVSDYDSRVETEFPFPFVFDLAGLASGSISGGHGLYFQAFAASETAHLALYNLGAYVQDEFQATPKLKLTMGVRIDRTGNPYCKDSCFSQYSGAFPSSNAGYAGPYNSDFGGPINSENEHPFPTVEKLNFQPRFGFNYALTPKTEIRAGAGLFSDLYPAGFLDGAVQNFPNYNAVTVVGGTLATSGAGSVEGNAVSANQAVQSGFALGQNVTQINNTLLAAGVPFTPPSIGAYFPGTFHVPEYLEYSLQLQRQLTRSDALILTYAGNYGYNEVLQNPYLNGASGLFDPNSGTFQDSGVEIQGLNITPADPRFTRITAYTNNAHSNYSGGMVALKHNGHGLTGQVSYTYSHSLDFVSNGGEGEPFNGGALGNQLTPDLGAGNLNYSNSDYDIRNNLVGDAVYDEPFKVSNRIVNPLVSGWSIGAKTYYRSGEPFSVTNSNIIADAGLTNTGGGFMAQLAPGVTQSQLKNNSSSNPKLCAEETATCLDLTQFVTEANQTTFGNIRRNALYGPHYTNTDLSLTKRIIKTEGMSLIIGANAYNVFNHANFGQPITGLTNTIPLKGGGYANGSFGYIGNTVAPPTSPYGSFQGAAVTQRLLQVHGKFTF